MTGISTRKDQQEQRMGNDRRLPALLGVVLISLAALWSSQAGAAEGTVLQAV